MGPQIEYMSPQSPNAYIADTNYKYMCARTRPFVEGRILDNEAEMNVRPD